MPKRRKLNCAGLMSPSAGLPVASPSSRSRAPAQASRVLSTYWTTTAPRITPQMFPMPPRMIMITTRIDVENWKNSDVVAPW